MLCFCVDANFIHERIAKYSNLSNRGWWCYALQPNERSHFN